MTPSHSDSVKMLALIAILASQIPIFTSLIERIRRHKEVPALIIPQAPQRVVFPIFVGQQLYGLAGNPIDGLQTNYVEVTAVSNGWVRIRYEEPPRISLTLTESTVETCFEPTARIQKNP